ncbi:MAG: hypothetical protein K0S04_3530 [Herbinix sp.]|jgi:hypothetical protein|nr:hypothetical protein [Herbinix sp.]
MNMRKRFLIILLVLVVSCVPLLSLLYIDVHVNHICTGTECRVCEHIEAAVQTINHFKNLFIQSILILVAVLMTAYLCVVREIVYRSGDTLITLKVELLN